MKVERTVTIAAPAERVYDVVMDPARLHEWVSIHDHVENAPRGLLERGSTMTQTLKLAGRRFNVHWIVVENEPCRRVVWEGRGPVASHARVIYEFTEDGDKTRFSYSNEYDLPGGFLGRIAGRTVSRITAKELDHTLSQLKRLVE